MFVTSIHGFELKVVREKEEILGVDIKEAEPVTLKVIMQTQCIRCLLNFLMRRLYGVISFGRKPTWFWVEMQARSAHTIRAT